MTAIKGATLLNNMTVKEALGSTSLAWHSELSKDLFLRRARVTIELFFSDGTVRRIATDPITVDDYGTDVNYMPELVEEPELLWAIEMGKAEAESRSIEISIRRDSIDPASMVASGAFLAGFGEVAIQMDGGNYEDRIVVLRGQMAGGVTFGNPGEPLTVTLKDPRDLLDSEFPPQVVKQEEFPSVPKESVGERVPIIYNEWPNVPCIRINSDVGTVQRGTFTEMVRATMPDTEDVIASQLMGTSTTFQPGWSKGNGFVKVEDEILRYESAGAMGIIKEMINLERAQFGTKAAEHTAFSTSFENVAVYHKSEWVICSGHDLTIDQSKGVFDGQGETLSNVSNPTTISYPADTAGNNFTKLVFDEPTTYSDLYTKGEDDVEFTNDDDIKRVDWSGAQGAFVSVTRGEKHSVPQIIEDVMVNYSPSGEAILDPSSVANLQPVLGAVFPSVLINGSGDGDQAGSLSWIEQTLLPAFPMVSSYFSDGKYKLCVFDARSTSKGTFEVGQYPMMDRLSMIQESDVEGTHNQFSVRYKFDPTKGTHTEFRQLDAGNNAYCRRSETMMGTRKMPVMESPYINNESDADLLLGWYAYHRSRPFYTVEYCFSPWALINLELGDVIEITDPEVGFADSKAVIESMTYQRSKVVLSLKVFPVLPGT